MFTASLTTLTAKPAISSAGVSRKRFIAPYNPGLFKGTVTGCTETNIAVERLEEFTAKPIDWAMQQVERYLQHLETLPDTCTTTQVFRLARADTSTGQPSYTSFELSSEDRTQIPPKLSVWMVGLTQPWEARLLSAQPHLYPFALYLITDTIRDLVYRLPGHLPRYPPLDVVWDPLPTPASYIARPRWLDGHCGIAGLERPPGMPRQVYKTLRFLLFKESQVVPLSSGS